MSIRVASYNIEWFNHCFNADNSLNLEDKTEQLTAVKQVLELLQADLITIIEAPNTTTTTGEQNAVTKLQNFANWANLRTTRAMIGFPSAGQQEIAILYNPDKMTVTHTPGGTDSRSNPPFNGEFYFDTDDDHIKEVYKNYRPPLEAQVQLADGNTFRVLGVHAKSKGIFNAVDQVHLERENRRNRLKLFAECSWVRKRIDDWLDAGHAFAVMGDINDGPEMDIYEQRYGRSAVEILMGSLFEPERILRNYIPRPQWKNYGWTPSSARFKDRITGDYINVLIDHILASPNLPIAGTQPVKIWNPYEQDDISAHKSLFKKASDHFPVTIDIAF